MVGPIGWRSGPSSVAIEVGIVPRQADGLGVAIGLGFVVGRAVGVAAGGLEAKPGEPGSETGLGDDPSGTSEGAEVPDGGCPAPSRPPSWIVLGPHAATRIATDATIPNPRRRAPDVPIAPMRHPNPRQLA